jgi:hypothetical protein
MKNPSVAVCINPREILALPRGIFLLSPRTDWSHRYLEIEPIFIELIIFTYIFTYFSITLKCQDLDDRML